MNAIGLNDVAAARTFLFVPADRPDRFAKAVATGADVVVLDLEDAVAPINKDLARDHARTWLAAGNTAMVRINSSQTSWHNADVELIKACGPPVMLPKAERSAHVRRLLTAGAPAVVPLIETALGVHQARALCAVAGVPRIAFGSIDFATQLGIRPDDQDALHTYRSLLVLASAAAGLAPPIDGVTTAFTDPEKLIADVAYARRLGMTAKLCVHPAQVSIVHAASVPSEDEILWAQAVLGADTADGHATTVAGEMIDTAVVERARRIVAAAARRG
ncbi:CoA ester lyase [Mycobacterium sp. 236(2023)]|uniref:HpcH/HpaI aldolase/citrate lyase family protein n=1 Tax=Mycobacterium sp. 236(2023) TaxID=3038163 RepID=UPI0024153B5C|nr:CoA ester lyase [Mycobacterium sp. 236(2023)]MDG4668099.1 CoA ester lyase [Mycobacterium sp. 236(2023)]